MSHDHRFRGAKVNITAQDGEAKNLHSEHMTMNKLGLNWSDTDLLRGLTSKSHMPAEDDRIAQGEHFNLAYVKSQG